MVGAPRIGFGYDVHRLVSGRRLVLGGVEIPFHLGLEGHSDADALLHAIADALLGALGEGDIGRHFPPGDARYKDMASTRLLADVAARAAVRGLRVGNVDATVIAEAPALAPYIPAMCDAVGRILGIDASRVNIKATTHEGLGALGRGEGVAAYAVLVLVSAASGA
ncbi:MAG: 2-C-methyl-D-erythritol 2,4-cyclodiphosphate synthase [Armatimonadetes bacterium]|nr:2-C-methyl-D-erythritol 2,4-cyclodiphosphate synthase [Armatimonadota bacterium]